MNVDIIVEGESDRQVARKLVIFCGGSVGRIIPTHGKSKLDQRIQNYCNAARKDSPWLVLRDADHECPVQLRSRLLNGIDSQWFRLRIACSMVEAWLLADTSAIQSFFGVPVEKVPANPDALAHAKTSLLQLVAKYSSKPIRVDMVADIRGKLKPGPLYVERINDFAKNTWDISRAQSHSESLSRAISSVSGLVESSRES